MARKIPFFDENGADVMLAVDFFNYETIAYFASLFAKRRTNGEARQLLYVGLNNAMSKSINAVAAETGNILAPITLGHLCEMM